MKLAHARVFARPGVYARTWFTGSQFYYTWELVDALDLGREIDLELRNEERMRWWPVRL